MRTSHYAFFGGDFWWWCIQLCLCCFLHTTTWCHLHVAGVGNDGVWPVFNTTSHGSGGQGAGGGGVGGEGVPVSLIPFPPQVHKCPSQATHVHNLTYQALKITDSALSVEDFGRVLSRRESVLIY